MSDQVQPAVITKQSRDCLLGDLYADENGPCLKASIALPVFSPSATGCLHTTYCCTAVLSMEQLLSLCACRVAWICGASVQQHRSSHAEAGRHPAQPQVLLDAGAPTGRHQGSLRWSQCSQQQHHRVGGQRLLKARCVHARSLPSAMTAAFLAYCALAIAASSA